MKIQSDWAREAGMAEVVRNMKTVMEVSQT